MAWNSGSKDSIIKGIKRMRISWDMVIDAEEVCDISLRNSSTRRSHTHWLTLRVGPGNDGLDLVMDADKEGEKSRPNANWLTLKIGSCGENGLNMVMAGNHFTGYIPEEIMSIIFSKVPLHTLLQVESICASWHTIISSSVYFHNLWAQNNKQMWLVMDLHETDRSSNGIALFDISRKLWLKKLFNDDPWRSCSSEWYLRAGDGGLLVYSCKRNGILKVLNPLTMESHSLEDARLSRKTRISFYMKKYHDDVGILLKVDSKDETYQVIVIIGNLYLVRTKKFHVLIYRSTEQRWEIRSAHFNRRVSGSVTIRHFPNILMHNQRIQCISTHGKDVGIYDLNADRDSRFSYFFGIQGVRHEVLGIVIYQGRTMMVCKNKTRNIPWDRDTLYFYEFDEVGLSWRSEHEPVVLHIKLPPKLIICGGDCVWVIQESNVHVSYMISIDVDSGELNVWPGVSQSMFNVRNCLSMPLRFFPCKLEYPSSNTI